MLIQATHALEFAHSEGHSSGYQDPEHHDWRLWGNLSPGLGNCRSVEHLDDFQDGLVGTFGMAPEMLSGHLEDVSKATDIFSWEPPCMKF